MEMDRTERTLSANTDVERASHERGNPIHKPWHTGKIGCLLLMLLMILLGGVVGYFIHRNNGRSHGLTDPSSTPQNLVCVPCEDAGVKVPGAGDHRHRHDQGPLCCFSKSNGQVRYTFSSKAAQALEQEKKDRPCQQSNSKKPSAFLYLDYTKTKEMRDALHWCSETPYSEGTGHLSASLQYNTKYGGLIIPEAGVYKVYSQITFRRLPNASAPTLYIHCLFRVRAHQEEKEPQIVICSQTTKMNVTDARILQPSYFQAEINVNSSDILFVNVSDIGSVYGSYMDNYFGLSKL